MGRKKPETMEKERKEFLEKLVEYHGITRHACLAIGIKDPYKWISRSIERDPDFEAEYECIKKEQRELILDVAEMGLYQKITKDRNLTAMIFFLKTQGQHRGWIEKQHIITETDIDVVFEEVDLLNGNTENTELSDTEDVSEAGRDIQ